MKTTIEYYKRDSDIYPCGAKMDTGNFIMVGIGESWEEAKQNLIKNYKKQKPTLSIPEPETIELNSLDLV